MSALSEIKKYISNSIESLSFFLHSLFALQSTNGTRDQRMGRISRSTAQNRERFDGESGVPRCIRPNFKSIRIFVHIRHRTWGWRYLKRLCFVYDGAITPR